jgi:ParB family chromosome partitioning protein
MSRDILLSLIDPDPDQPRKHFDAIEELAQSMSENGLVQAIMVRPGKEERYIIVHGERRWRAAKHLGWEHISAEIRDLTPDEAHWLSLVENVQRSELSPIEEADSYQGRLVEGLTQDRLGKRIGKTQSYIAQKLRLLKLPDDVRLALNNGKITEGHARQLLRLDDPAIQSQLCEKAANEEWPIMRLRLEIDQALRPKACLEPESPAELAVWFFKQGGISRQDNHAEPYPEERLPEYFQQPGRIAYLPIASVTMDPKLDIRSERDMDYTEWLCEIFDILPPVAVFSTNGEYLLSDGWYRVTAAKQRGLTELEARIYEGDFTTALHYAAAANSVSGLRLNKGDMASILHKKGQQWLR